MTADPNRKLKVFLCHSSHDKPAVREIYRRLKAEGWIDPWLDDEKLFPGQDWDLEIEKAVEETDAVLVFLSDNSVDKEGYIQRELRLILNMADYKPEGTNFILPLRLNECVLPRRLRSWHYVDNFPEERKEWAYGRLLGSLKLRAKKLGVSSSSITKEKEKIQDTSKKTDTDIIEPPSLNVGERLGADVASFEKLRNSVGSALVGTELQRSSETESDDREIKSVNKKGDGDSLLANLLAQVKRLPFLVIVLGWGVGGVANYLNILLVETFNNLPLTLMFIWLEMGFVINGALGGAAIASMLYRKKLVEKRNAYAIVIAWILSWMLFSFLDALVDGSGLGDGIADGVVGLIGGGATAFILYKEHLLNSKNSIYLGMAIWLISFGFVGIRLDSIYDYYVKYIVISLFIGVASSISVFLLSRKRSE